MPRIRYRCYWHQTRSLLAAAVRSAWGEDLTLKSPGSAQFIAPLELVILLHETVDGCANGAHVLDESSVEPDGAQKRHRFRRVSGRRHGLTRFSQGLVAVHLRLRWLRDNAFATERNGISLISPADRTLRISWRLLRGCYSARRTWRSQWMCRRGMWRGYCSRAPILYLRRLHQSTRRLEGLQALCFSSCVKVCFPKGFP